jgi:rhodanese-related sulfurtransferase
MSDLIEFLQMNWLLFLALFVVLSTLIGSELLRIIRGVKMLNALGVLRILNDQGAWIVDVRADSEYREGHIPQAHHIPLASLKERINEFLKADGKPIVVYCHSGKLSQAAYCLLKKNRISNVYALSGGLQAWLDAQLPISRKR